MTEQINDGGSAFPIPDQRHAGGLDGSYGMSLRDYFAALAMQAEISLWSEGGWTQSSAHIANKAYIMADAMIERRQRQK